MAFGAPPPTGDGSLPNRRANDLAGAMGAKPMAPRMSRANDLAGAMGAKPMNPRTAMARASADMRQKSLADAMGAKPMAPRAPMGTDLRGDPAVLAGEMRKQAAPMGPLAARTAADSAMRQRMAPPMGANGMKPPAPPMAGGPFGMRPPAGRPGPWGAMTKAPMMTGQASPFAGAGANALSGLMGTRGDR